MSWCCYETVCFNVVTASEEEDEDDDFLGAEDFSRKKVTLDKSKPAKATEVSFSFLVLKIIIVLYFCKGSCLTLSIKLWCR